MYHRKESPTQTISDAVEQVKTGEVWGGPGRQGRLTAVRAYTGELSGVRGIEFLTSVVPEFGGGPLEAHWYLGKTAGVQARTKCDVEYACIVAQVTNLQP